MAQAAPQLSVAEQWLLQGLHDDGRWTPAETVAAAIRRSAQEVLAAAGGPERHGLVELAADESRSFRLTAEGEFVLKEGLPERRAVRLVARTPDGVPVAQIGRRAVNEREVPIAVAWLKRKRWARIEKTPSGPVLFPDQAAPERGPDEDTLARAATGSLTDRDAKAAAELVERGLLETSVERAWKLRLTPAGVAAKRAIPHDFAKVEEVNQLTPELVAAWAAMTPQEKARQRLRPFDFGVDVAVPAGGKAHPLTHIIEEIRDIFVALGFQEIAGDYVEPAFWNMDALFIPQDHPAREMQDTFYVKDPARLPVDDRLFGVVKDVQTTGGKTGSTGWGGSFRKEESERALLRTHTTVTTVRHLAAHPKGPSRVFGIGRVFRNEAMDATHLPEFHQVEGIVVEDGATLAMLMGILREFYKRMGFPQVKFRPSFYPYTEPSLDVAVQWNGRWLELGGAGVFRPEVTLPLGVKSPVLAWGLGLERLAMLRLGLTDIRQLYLSDVQWLRESPLR
jgi:phenylalanyl-tRNA synthetase alpha chain